MGAPPDVRKEGLHPALVLLDLHLDDSPHPLVVGVGLPRVGGEDQLHRSADLVNQVLASHLVGQQGVPRLQVFFDDVERPCMFSRDDLSPRFGVLCTAVNRQCWRVHPAPALQAGAVLSCL